MEKEKLAEDFVNWYFGKKEYWGAHDYARANLMRAELVRLLKEFEKEIKNSNTTLTP